MLGERRTADDDDDGGDDDATDGSCSSHDMIP